MVYTIPEQKIQAEIAKPNLLVVLM